MVGNQNRKTIRKIMIRQYIKNFILVLGICMAILMILFSASAKAIQGFPREKSSNSVHSANDTAKRKALLTEIINLLPPDNLNNGTVSSLDKTFNDWLQRTGELPPDFDKLPSINSLPDALVFDEGKRNIPVRTGGQWQNRKKEIAEKLQYYITGTFPEISSTEVHPRIIHEGMDGDVAVRTVELNFGPDLKAKLTLELYIPPGDGLFPVFLTQWNHRGWAQIAVRRGYIGCIYAGSDDKDDTENYGPVWDNQYDFTRIMRRAFAASRAIDYLYELPFIDREKIGLTGHSRNGKLSLWAAAFDERIKAVIPSSGGSGGEVPWRYTSHKYDVEDIALLSCAQPSWLHPRLRFFIGREDKLPVDQNLFMALIAPRGLMLSAAVNEVAANTLGIEQAFIETGKVYRFLGAEDKLAIRFREGQHGTNANDIEAYIDFFDYVFNRSAKKPSNELVSNFSFENWKKLSGEKIDPGDYPVHPTLNDIKESQGKKFSSKQQWEKEKLQIQKQIEWALGKKPSGFTNPGPGKFLNEDGGENYFGTSIKRPVATDKMGRIAFAPYDEFGDYLYGYLYYPKDKEPEIKSGSIKLPVVIYQHEFDYSKGFSSQYYDHDIATFFQKLVNNGFAVFSYDMIGFGTRLQEGKWFYQRYPHWSKMGKMVTDLQGAITLLSNLNFIDSTKINVAGYSLGATVGLFTSALDNRIAKTISVCGFMPLRSFGKKDISGLKFWTQVTGLLPRLGFFVGNENRLPFDFHEILSCIAQRQLLLVAPSLDREVSSEHMEKIKNKVENIFNLYGVPDKFQIFSPMDYNRFSVEMQTKIIAWLQ